MLQSLKHFEHWHGATSGKFYTWPHVMGHSQNTGTKNIVYCIKFQVMCIKYTWNINFILHLCLIPKIFCYVHENIPKFKKNSKSETFLVPSILDEILNQYSSLYYGAGYAHQAFLKPIHFCANFMLTKKTTNNLLVSGVWLQWY